jgi:hypothetical protein
LADVVVVGAHHAERVEVYAAVVQRTDSDIAATEIVAVTAGHAVDVHADHVARRLQCRIQRQRSARATLVNFLCPLDQLRQLALDAVEHRVPQQLLADTLH